jgi:sugar phosphate isomerase/epimerase
LADIEELTADPRKEKPSAFSSGDPKRMPHDHAVAGVGKIDVGAIIARALKAAGLTEPR